MVPPVQGHRAALRRVRAAPTATPRPHCRRPRTFVACRLAAEHAGTVFAKVDVDVCEETAQKCGVNSMPTFQHFDRGSKVAELVGRPLPPTPLNPPVGLSKGSR